MDFIVTDPDRVDVGAMPPTASLDLEVGSTAKNDYEITIPLEDYDKSLIYPGCWFYAIGTEYGGVIANPDVDTKKGTVTFTGDTFRGLLEYKITQPPGGRNYLTLTGNATAILRQLIGSQFGDLFRVVDGSTAQINAYEVPRYASVAEAIHGALASAGCRLKISVVYDGAGFVVELSAVPVVDYSDEEEVSQDSGVDFKIKLQTLKYTHMVCGNSKEATSTTINLLEVQEDGTAKVVSSIPNGVNVRVYFYDKSPSSTTKKLLEECTKKFKDINKTDTQEVETSSESDIYEVGDIIGGRDYATGLVVAEPITQKIIKIEDGSQTVSYKLGE